MERLMERKLALLEADYAETLAAEARATAARSSAVTSPEVARAAGYIDATSAPNRADYVEHEEWSAAWTAFRAEMAEEERRIAALPPSDDDADGHQQQSTAPSAAQPALHAPLTPAKVSAIKSYMSTVKLRPPPWAAGLSEDVWTARILERAGFARRLQPPVAERKEEKTDDVNDDEQKRRRRAKRKAKKTRQAKRDQGAAKDGQVGADDGFAQFEASFPALAVGSAAGHAEEKENGERKEG